MPLELPGEYSRLITFLFSLPKFHSKELKVFVHRNKQFSGELEVFGRKGMEKLMSAKKKDTCKWTDPPNRDCSPRSWERRV